MRNLDILWEKVKQQSSQRKIQAKEYERRLQILNGEADRLKRMQETYLEKTTFDRYAITEREKNEATIRELRKEIKELSDWKTAQSGTSIGMKETRDKFDKYVPWIFSFATLIMMYLIYMNSKK